MYFATKILKSLETHNRTENQNFFCIYIDKKATFAGNCENYDDKTHNNRRKYIMLMGRTFARPERMRMFFKQYLNEMVQLGVNSIGIVLLISFSLVP